MDEGVKREKRSAEGGDHGSKDSAANAAGQGMVRANFFKAIGQPNVTLHFKHRSRWLFANLHDNELNYTTTGTYNAFQSNWFEIPQNHMGFYITAAENSLLQNCAAWKINHASWKINAMDFVALNEVNPSATAPYYHISGNNAPMIETMCSTTLDIPWRVRYWNYINATDGARSTPDNTASGVTNRADIARKQPERLPLITFGYPLNGITSLASDVPNAARTPDWYDYVETRTLESEIGHQCNIFPHWRRTRERGQDLGPTQSDVAYERFYAPPTVLETGIVQSTKPLHPRHQFGSIADPRGDFVGYDLRDRTLYYRDGRHGGGTFENEFENTNYFLRPRGPPRELIANNPLLNIPMTFIIDIETNMNVDLSYTWAAMDNNGGALYNGNQKYLYRSGPEEYNIDSGELPLE